MGDSYDEEIDVGFDDDDDEDEGAGAHDRAHGAPFGDLSQMYGDVALGERDERGGSWGGPGERFLRGGPGQHPRERSRSDYSDDGWSSASSQSLGSEDRSTNSVEAPNPEPNAMHQWL